MQSTIENKPTSNRKYGLINNEVTDKNLFSVNEGSVFIIDRGKIRKIDISNIQYLQVDKPYCQLHLLKEKTNVFIRKSLTDILNFPEFTRFLRIHRSLAVNQESIQTYIRATHTLHLKNNYNLQVGKTYRNKVFQFFKLIK